MKILAWIIQGLLALAFIGAGMMKLVTPFEELAANPNMGWANDFSAIQIKIIGALEVLGALGVILPMFVKKYKILVPVAAGGLALTMVGAAITHIVRGEPFIPTVILFLLAIAVIWLRKDFLKRNT